MSSVTGHCWFGKAKQREKALWLVYKVHNASFHRITHSSSTRRALDGHGRKGEATLSCIGEKGSSPNRKPGLQQRPSGGHSQWGGLVRVQKHLEHIGKVGSAAKQKSQQVLRMLWRCLFMSSIPRRKGSTAPHCFIKNSNAPVQKPALRSVLWKHDSSFWFKIPGSTIWLRCCGQYSII